MRITGGGFLSYDRLCPIAHVFVATTKHPKRGIIEGPKSLYPVDDYAGNSRPFEFWHRVSFHLLSLLIIMSSKSSDMYDISRGPGEAFGSC